MVACQILVVPSIVLPCQLNQMSGVVRKKIGGARGGAPMLGSATVNNTTTMPTLMTILL